MTNPTPSPEAEALPTLPVVAWRRRYLKPTGAWAYLSTASPEAPLLNPGLGPQETESLTLHAPAEAAIVALRAEVERLTMQIENLSAEGQLAYKVSENVGRNALQCAQDLLQKNVELRALVAEMLELSDNWPGVAYAKELEVRARATLLGDGGTL